MTLTGECGELAYAISVIIEILDSIHTYSTDEEVALKKGLALIVAESTNQDTVINLVKAKLTK